MELLYFYGKKTRFTHETTSETLSSRLVHYFRGPRGCRKKHPDSASPRLSGATRFPLRRHPRTGRDTPGGADAHAREEFRRPGEDARKHRTAAHGSRTRPACARKDPARPRGRHDRDHADIPI